MDNEKFKIINLVKDLIVQIDKNLVNFPKKEIELKREIKTTSYNLLLLTYEANNTDNKERKHELQEKAVAYVKYLNFFFNLCYDKQIINNKKYLKFGEKLDIIVRYLVAWKNSEQKNIGV